jgi:hypothetical protein
MAAKIKEQIEEQITEKLKEKIDLKKIDLEDG